MYHLLKITGTDPISPICIKDIGYQGLYTTQLNKHSLVEENFLYFENIDLKDTLDLRPLYLNYFNSIIRGPVPAHLIFNNIPYFNYFISKAHAGPIKFLKRNSSRVFPPIILNTMIVRTNELPPFFLNINLMRDDDLERYLRTIPQFREVILNQDYNSSLYQENILTLTSSLREYLGNNWINSENDGIL